MVFYVIYSLMPRKKSNTKKQREAIEKAQAESSIEKNEDGKNSSPGAESHVASQEESSSSSEEDEYGDLITEDIEEGLEKVLNTVREDPKKLLDPNVKFFNDPEDVSSAPQSTKKEKPLYLKDYHRMNLLGGGYKDDDQDNFEPRFSESINNTAENENEEKKKLIADIHGQFDEGEEKTDQNEDLFKVKEKQVARDDAKFELPDPQGDKNAFLDAYLEKQAWIPKNGEGSIQLDQIDHEDEDGFLDAADNFENAYNFRYEDPNSAEIVSYARNQATVRRASTNSRKRQRERKQKEKLEAKNLKDEELSKKKRTKVTRVMDRLAEIKEALGGEVNEDTIEKVFGESLLNDDFDDNEWDKKMSQIFDEQYYSTQDSTPISKPEWIEQDGPVADAGSEKDQKATESDALGKTMETEGEEEQPRKKSKKEKVEEKKTLKKEKEDLKKRAQHIVDSNAFKLYEEVEDERGRKEEKDDNLPFKYREVSPETFGLTMRDILVADDKLLNQYVGMKKLAPYRPREQVKKDKRKYGKKKRLKQWRKDTFKDFDRSKLLDEKNIWIPVDQVGQNIGKK